MEYIAHTYCIYMCLRLQLALNGVTCMDYHFMSPPNIYMHRKSRAPGRNSGRSGRQIGDLKLVFLDHFQTIFDNFPDILSMKVPNTSFKSYDFACTNRDMPQCGK